MSNFRDDSNNHKIINSRLASEYMLSYTARDNGAKSSASKLRRHTMELPQVKTKELFKAVMSRVAIVTYVTIAIVSNCDRNECPQMMSLLS